MESYFNLIYIVPNRFSEERICVAVLANISGLPYLGISDKKLSFSLSRSSQDMRKFIRKSFRLMEFDVNKIRRGEDSLSLFDQPYSLKILKELSLKKKGFVQYSDVFELKESSEDLFKNIFEKFTGERWEENKTLIKKNTFRKRFKDFSNDSKFKNFEKKYKLIPNEFPYIYKEVQIDLLRINTYITIFYPLDIDQTLQSIQRNLSQFRLIIQSLKIYSEQNGLGKGRYYLVYDSTRQKDKRALVEQIKAEKSSDFELIRMSEMKDKV